MNRISQFVRHRSVGIDEKKIREKLARMGVVLNGPSPAVMAGVDPGFVDLCVVQIIDQKSFTVKQLADMLTVSEDWVLDNFRDVAGMFRQGKIIRYPHEAVKAKIRSMLKL
jgi:hypothetical protein